MTSTVFQFRQDVPRRATPILLDAVAGPAKGEPFIVWELLGSAAASTRQSEEWDLDEHPGAFMRFMQLDSDESFRAFSAESGAFQPAFVSFHDVFSREGFGPANRLAEVRAEARAMADAWGLWQAVVSGDAASLRRMIRVYRPVHNDPEQAEWVRAVPSSEALAPYFKLEQLRTTAAPDDPAAAVSPLSDQDLVSWGSFILTRLFDKVIGARVTTRFVDQKGLAPIIVHSPTSLLAALWLQMHAAMSGDARFQECWGCAQPFEISRRVTLEGYAAGRRSQSVFCSNKCKARFQRLKPAIVSAYAEGRTIEQIASDHKVAVRGVGAFIAKGVGGYARKPSR